MIKILLSALSLYGIGLILNTAMVVLIAYKNNHLQRRYLRTMITFSVLSWVGIFILIRSTIIHYKTKPKT